MDLSDSHFDFAVNHVFLPPRLPDEEDEDLWGKELSLLRLVKSLAEQFASQLPHESSTKWQPVLVMLQTWMDTTRFGGIDEESLNAALKGLNVDGMLRNREFYQV